jgi:nicotinamide-nucleotide amidase
MRVEIVAIGTELLLGQIVDTNATKIAKMLRDIGADVFYKTTVGDNDARIVEVLNIALNRADMVITSGGLGPTVDDKTRQGVAVATGRALVYSHELEEQIRARFRGFGREMAENNKRQAFIPEGAQILTNPVGTAPCFLAEDTNGRGAIISLPGVPRELEYMMTHTVIPLLIARMGGAKIIKAHILRVSAVGESNIDNVITDLMELTNPTVGLAAHGGITDIRVAAKANNEAEADALIAPIEADLRQRLGVAIYGTGTETMPGVVAKLLSERGLTLSVVDVLTHGEVAQWLAQENVGHVLTNAQQFPNVAAAIEQLELDPTDLPAGLAAKIAHHIKPEKGMGLAMLGPFAKNSCFIAVAGPDDFVQVWPNHSYSDDEYRRKWLAIQSLDWVRRVLLGQLTSPVDWVQS